MKIIKTNYSIESICEGGLSRIWQKTHDTSQFAIIGSVDKDTKKDRFSELRTEIEELSRKRKIKNKPALGWKYLSGVYTYDDGSTAGEMSMMISNISREEAVRVAKKINQESIIWKDENYFGFVYIDDTVDGKNDGELSTNDKNMNFSDEAVRNFSSRLVSKHNKGQKFVFEMFLCRPEKEMSAIRNMAKSKVIKESLFRIKNK